MWDMLRRGNRRTVLSLSLFNILIGMGYFLLEIVLMLTYQNVFVAPSATFLFVLAVLLIGSAIGGALTKRIPPMIATIILIPLTLIALVAPTFLIQWSIPFGVIKILAVLLIGTIGLFMGVYFPRGLMVAKEKGMQKLVPSLFAVNSIAGAFAVVLALFLGVKVGYQETVLIALLCYVLAGLMLRSLVKR